MIGLLICNRNDASVQPRCTAVIDVHDPNWAKTVIVSLDEQHCPWAKILRMVLNLCVPDGQRV